VAATLAPKDLKIEQFHREGLMFGWGKRNAADTDSSGNANEVGPPIIAAVLMEGATYPIEQLRGKIGESTLRAHSNTNCGLSAVLK
jgi:hypothetical protein